MAMIKINNENIRHCFIVSLLVFGCAIFYTLLVVWALKKIILLEGITLQIVYVVVYVVIVFFGLKLHIPRLRGIV